MIIVKYMSYCVLALSHIFLLCCGISEDDADNPAEEWIGNWMYQELNNGEWAPRGDVISFYQQGVWVKGTGERGVYSVLTRQFVIDSAEKLSGNSPRGTWSIAGDTLTLDYNDGTKEVLRRHTPVFTPPNNEPPPTAVTPDEPPTTEPPPNIQPLPEPPGNETPPVATTAWTIPAAGSSIAPNAVLIVKLDENVDVVKVNGAAASGIGDTWTFNLTGLNLPEGSANLLIDWTNKDGTVGAGAVVPVVIQAEEDTTPPAIKAATVKHNEIRVDYNLVNRDGITIVFSEIISAGGEISIAVEGGITLKWSAHWARDSVTILPAVGEELDPETSYGIEISAEDSARNKLSTTISFTTGGKNEVGIIAP